MVCLSKVSISLCSQDCLEFQSGMRNVQIYHCLHIAAAVIWLNGHHLLLVRQIYLQSRVAQKNSQFVRQVPP
jgi:hypothetical protein